MPFKFSIDEDLLSVKTTPGLLERLFFFKHWTYMFDLPVKRISKVHVENRMGVATLVVHKISKEGIEKSFPVSISKANSAQTRFIKEAVPQIISEKLKMPEIAVLEKKYFKKKDITYL